MGTRERREVERKQRRQDILNAARRLFWDRGYEGTTMGDIARAVQLAPGTLYLYFPGKEALYTELLLEGFDVLAGRLLAAIQPDAPPRRQAEALVDEFVQFALDSPEYFHIVFFAVQREGAKAREIRFEQKQYERLTAREEACKKFAADILSRAGYRTSRADLQNAVDAIWSMLVGVIFYFSKRGPDDMVPIAREARELILRGVFGEEKE